MLQRAYYTLKPYLPWRVRIAVRRWYARRLREHHQSLWPINAQAGNPPAGWTGWPGGKRFALVLTHDVEGARGLEQVKDLAALETDLGFRSSFNFVPEGDYSTPGELRDSLTANGFEVAVHDLNHDGKLYWSRKAFRSRAQAINRYLTEWGAVGFRSAFMMRNLEWLQDLNILYDSSCFDTDPFEPQPDGAATIFPFWVPGRNGRGYVELPYTLPQDSTLFVLFGEKSIDVWKRKLDWIAKEGGMALLDVHPDYLNFSSKDRPAPTFPSRFYAEFLNYIREQYEGQYWLALPRDVAEYVRSMQNDNCLAGEQEAMERAI